MVAAFCVQVCEIAFLVAFGLGPELKPFGTESQLKSKTGGASVVFVWGSTYQFVEGKDHQ